MFLGRWIFAKKLPILSHWAASWNTTAFFMLVLHDKPPPLQDCMPRFSLARLLKLLNACASEVVVVDTDLVPRGALFVGLSKF